MKNKAGFYHKFSLFFLVFFLFSFVCMVGSILLQIKANAGYKDCNIAAPATLNSCVTQDSGNRTYYFGVYTFQYNGQEYHFVNPTYYTKESNVPKDVTIKHNAFTKKENMNVKVKYNRDVVIPIIYGVISAVLLILFIVYHQNYKEQLLILRSRENIKDVNAELDQELTLTSEADANIKAEE